MWFKVDDNLAMHPKVVEAGNAAMGLWVRAGSWCGAHLTDGTVPAHVVTLLGTRRQAEKLAASGLWIPAEGGAFEFHEWRERQPTRRQVDDERAKTARRVAEWRRRSQVSGESNAVTLTRACASCNALPGEVHAEGCNGVTSRARPSRDARSRPVPEVLNSSQSVVLPDVPRAIKIDRYEFDVDELRRRLTRTLGPLDADALLRIAEHVLANANGEVRDPIPYVVAAVEREPSRYRTTPTPPTKRSLCDHGRAKSSCPYCAGTIAVVEDDDPLPPALVEEVDPF